MKRRKSETLAEINITSLVDVALVLLIVFMIAAPFIRAGTKVVLPKAETREKHPKESMIIFVNQIGQVYFDGQNMTGCPSTVAVFLSLGRDRKKSPSSKSARPPSVASRNFDGGSIGSLATSFFSTILSIQELLQFIKFFTNIATELIYVGHYFFACSVTFRIVSAEVDIRTMLNSPLR